jgi:hypothetical protein
VYPLDDGDYARWQLCVSIAKGRDERSETEPAQKVERERNVMAEAPSKSLVPVRKARARRLAAALYLQVLASLSVQYTDRGSSRWSLL